MRKPTLGSAFVVKDLVLEFLGVVDRGDDGDETQNPGHPQQRKLPVALSRHGRLDESEHGKDRTEETAIEQELFHHQTSEHNDTLVRRTLASQWFVD